MIKSEVYDTATQTSLVLTLANTSQKDFNTSYGVLHYISIT